MARTKSSPEVRAALAAVLVARTAINGALRLVYPFLPAMARGLDVSLTTAAAAVAVRNLGGLSTPLSARVSERFGRRPTMLAAVLAVTAGCALTAVSPTFMLAAIGIAVVGFAKPTFDVAMQAWFADRVDERERGRVFGISELTWALSLVAVVPASGVLIGSFGWRAPFVLAGILAAGGALVLARLIASDRPEHHVERPLNLSADRLAILAVAIAFICASELMFVVYGSWLERDLGLSVASIGAFTMVVVAAELTGEGVVVLAADRLGLRRSTLIGLLVSTLAYGCFALVGSSVWRALALVFVWVASFELTIVSAIPLAAGFAPEARDRMLSALAFCVAAGRVLGALVGPRLFATGGIALNGAVAAALTVAAAATLARLRAHR